MNKILASAEEAVALIPDGATSWSGASASAAFPET